MNDSKTSSVPDNGDPFVRDDEGRKVCSHEEMTKWYSNATPAPSPAGAAGIGNLAANQQPCPPDIAKAIGENLADLVSPSPPPDAAATARLAKDDLWEEHCAANWPAILLRHFAPIYAERDELRDDRTKVIKMLNDAALEGHFDGYDEDTELWRSFASHLNRYERMAEKIISDIRAERDALKGEVERLASLLDREEALNGSFCAERDAMRVERDGARTALAASNEQREELERALESALRYFEAMPEASPHAKPGGVWNCWTDGCNIIRATLTRIRANRTTI